MAAHHRGALSCKVSNSDSTQPDLTTLSQLIKYTDSAGNRVYLRRNLPFLASGGCNHLQYILHLQTDGWLGRVDLGGLVKYQHSILANWSPISVVTWPPSQTNHCLE